jgi:hypothetical protein
VHDAHEYHPDELQTLNVCPRCAPEIEVQTLGQKGIDRLRQEYRLLLKPGYQAEGDRAEQRAQLERFFVHIGQQL